MSARLESHSRPVDHPRSDAGDAALLLAAALACIYALGAAAVIGPAPGQSAALIGIASLQTGWLLAARHLRRGAMRLGAALNLLLVAMWLLSRSVGLPVGPAGPQPIGVLDTLCAFDSGAIVVLALGLRCPPGMSTRWVTPARWGAILLAVGSLSALHAHGSDSRAATLASGTKLAPGHHFYCQLL